MNKLVIHHTYAHGMTFDVSKHNNHGIPKAIAPSAGLWANSFSYQAGDSEMTVRLSASLRDLGAIRARVRFFHTPAAGGGRRHNLMEGHLTFALFINPDRSLQGTILDRTGAWRGAKSAPGLVAPNMWHQAEFVHDGVSQCQIFLDGALVAAAFGVPGPVRSVGAHGVAIGHWPEPDPRYTFQGYIGEVQLYKYDPKEELRQLLDPCCIDRKALDQIMERLRKEGWNGEKLGDRARRLLDLCVQIAGAVRAGDPVQTERSQQIAASAVAAFMRRDGEGFRASFARSMEQAAQNLSEDQIRDFARQVVEQVKALPIPPEEFIELAKALCWEHGVVPDVEELRDRVWKRKPGRDDNRRDRREPHR